VTQASFGAKDFAMAAGVVAIWGLNFVVMKWGLRDFTPLQLVAARFTLASLPLIAFIARPNLPWKFWVGYGLLQGVGQFGLLATALAVGMSASLASVLMQTQVFFTALIAALALGERPNRAQRWALGAAAIALMLFAIEIIATKGHGTPASPGFSQKLGSGSQFGAAWLALALNLGAAALWATSNVVVRRAQALKTGYDATALVVWSCVPAILPLLALSWWIDPPQARSNWLNASWQAWACAAYLAFGATVVAYTLWTRLLQRHVANRVAPFSLGVPVVGLLAGMGFLGERLSAWQWAGVVAVFAALAITVWGGRWLPEKS
jgi:O-acetylserine/cysteine efflux transporter